MKNRTRKKPLFRRELLYKTCIFIGTVILLVFFLPREAKFNYQYEIGKPWKYGPLIATFDFPIFKSNDAIKKEQDSLAATLKPYFDYNQDKEREAISFLQKDYKSHLSLILPSSKYLIYIEQNLHKIYQCGIIPSEDVNKLLKNDTKSIMVIKTKMAQEKSTDQLFTEKKAYEFLLSADTLHFKTEILQKCALNKYITPNLTSDIKRMEIAHNDMFRNYSWAIGVVQSGQKIIERGEIITPKSYNILESFKKESAKRIGSAVQRKLILGGQIIFVSALIFFFLLYIDMFKQKYYARKRIILLLFTLIVIPIILTALLISHHVLTVYIIPYAMVAIIISIFLDSQTSFFAYILMIFICSITLHFPYEFILLQSTAGLIAIYSLKELSQRSQVFRSAIYIVITYFMIYIAYILFTEGSISKIDTTMLIYFIINGLFLLFTYPLLFLIEKTFGFTSNVTLVELSNINTPLLRNLSETAPGTFQHSLQVANLASEAAISIDANSQLVRTGALYHDIGKMAEPAFFTENQSGNFNPHKQLSYEESAQIVINHVTDGLKMADKYQLPKIIKDFISTHHGKSKTKFFYISWMNEHPDLEPDEKTFSYPGPNPFSKETAILMMADSVEAASRSLTEYTEESISNLVEKIIDSQVEEGSFKECPITFKDISTIKAVFKEKLRIAYHTRISYPELKK